MSEKANQRHQSSRDDRLVRAVEERLRACHYWHLQSITCERKEGLLTIRGRVPSYYLRKIAEVLASQVDGVDEIMNVIEVVGPDTWHHVKDPHSAP